MQPSSTTTRRGRPAGRALLLVAHVPMHRCTGRWRQHPHQTGWVGCRHCLSTGSAAPRRPPQPGAAPRPAPRACGSAGRGDAPDRRRRGQVQVHGELAGQGVQHFAAAASGRSRAACEGARPEAPTLLEARLSARPHGRPRTWPSRSSTPRTSPRSRRGAGPGRAWQANGLGARLAAADRCGRGWGDRQATGRQTALGWRLAGGLTRRRRSALPLGLRQGHP
jgi:hypothetical protein